VIYRQREYNHLDWFKTYYKLSSDGKTMTLGRDYLEKINIKPWTKEDLIGMWYFDYSKNCRKYYIFTDDLLVIKTYKDDIQIYEDTPVSMKITLMDEYFTGILFFGDYRSELPGESTCYYYIVDNILILYNGTALLRCTE
jgi:hypothetical protein